MGWSIFMLTTQSSSEQQAAERGGSLGTAHWLPGNSLTRKSSDWAQAPPVKPKEEAEPQQKKWSAVIWSEKQHNSCLTRDLRCHWECFLFPTHGCGLLWYCNVKLSKSHRNTTLLKLEKTSNHSPNHAMSSTKPHPKFPILTPFERFQGWWSHAFTFHHDHTFARGGIHLRKRQKVEQFFWPSG